MMEGGFVRVTRMRQITIHDVTPELARRSGILRLLRLSDAEVAAGHLGR